MKTRKRKTVLLAMDWYVHEIDLGVARYARERGWILDDIACHAREIPGSWRGDGILALFTGDKPNEIAKYVAKSRLPVVALSDQLPEIKVPRVLPDNEEIGAVAAHEFLSRGFVHFAFWSTH